MLIQVIGVGCPRCQQMKSDVATIVSRLGLDAKVEYVDDPMRIVEMGILSVPRLMIDGQLLSFRYRGRRSIEEVLEKASNGK